VPRWSPDGRAIVFSPDRGYSRGVFVVNADGTGERRVTERGGWPIWWPDGKRLGYRIIGADGNQQILTVPIEGGPSTPIESLRFVGANFPFDVSRDGRLIVTTNSAHVSDEIWLLRPER
jgi:Tol biopolymer transport system component